MFRIRGFPHVQVKRSFQNLQLVQTEVKKSTGKSHFATLGATLATPPNAKLLILRRNSSPSRCFPIKHRQKAAAQGERNWPWGKGQPFETAAAQDGRNCSRGKEQPFGTTRRCSALAR